MVLTAAHCLFDRDGKVYPDVKVFVGTNKDRTKKIVTIDKPGKKIRTKEICIHPDFNIAGDPSKMVKHGIR